MNNSQPQPRTYQTRLLLDKRQEASLDAYAELYCRAEHKLYAAICAGRDPDKMKPAFMKVNKLTARQYNAIARNLKGKIKSVAELQTLHISELDSRIKKARKVIGKAKNPFKRHNKKRRLATLESRLASLLKDKADGQTNICFGSRKLFKKQFHLADNGYVSHEAWLADWKLSRNSQFFVIGSKDENAGCQGCVATIEFDGSLTLRLRLPDALVSVGDKYVIIDDVRFL